MVGCTYMGSLLTFLTSSFSFPPPPLGSFAALGSLAEMATAFFRIGFTSTFTSFDFPTVTVRDETDEEDEEGEAPSPF